MSISNNLNRERKRIIINEELKPFIVQLKARDDPETANWIPTNKHAVAGGRFFIDEKQPSGEYELLSIPTLNGNFSGRTLTAGMCGVTVEDAEAENEERSLFPGIDRILAMAYPDEKMFVAQLAEAAWLTNPAYTAEYVEIITE